MAVIRLPEPIGAPDFHPFPIRINIDSITSQKYFGFYFETMNNKDFKEFFREAISIKINLEKEAETKKEQDIISSQTELVQLQLRIDEILKKMTYSDIKPVFCFKRLDDKIMELSQFYDVTFNDVYLNEEILEDFRKYIETSKNTSVPKQLESTLEKKYKKYLLDKSKLNKEVKKRSLRYNFINYIQFQTVLTTGVNSKTLELKSINNKPPREAKEILRKNEESIELVIKFIRSLTYEEIQLFVELYDLLDESNKLIEVYQENKKKIEKEYGEYINNIWYKTYEELKIKYPNNIPLEKRLIIEYYRIFLFEKIGKYETNTEIFNLKEYNKDIYEAIEKFFMINSKAIDEIEIEVTNHIYNYFETKLENNKILRK